MQTIKFWFALSLLLVMAVGVVAGFITAAIGWVSGL